MASADATASAAAASAGSGGGGWSITDFDLGQPVGKGRFGSVYHALDKKTGR